MADKILAKDFVEATVGKQYVIPTLGVWRRFKDIDFEKLPDQFVLKTNHDSGGIVLVPDKAALDKKKARKKLNKSLRRNFYWYGREPQYKNIRRRIFAEAYISNDGGTVLRDYKFFCFHGEPRFLYVAEELANHKIARLKFLNMDWTAAGFTRSDYPPLDAIPPKPDTFDEMVRIARKLSAGIPHIRVDLYDVNGRVYVGELTFFNCSGMMPLDPPEADVEIGKLLDLPK